MNKSHIPKAAFELIDKLSRVSPYPESIWLIGSRANGRATDSSDTDLVVFATLIFLENLRTAMEPPSSIDIFVVYDGDNFLDPWQQKGGSLTSFKWKLIDERQAKYLGTKWISDKESAPGSAIDTGQFLHREEQAIRVWP